MKSELIGKEFVAKPCPSNPWVECSEGNDGEKDYYRDVYDSNRMLVYCDGETCEVVGLDHEKNTVFMKNENTDLVDYIFEISAEQFEIDFERCV